MEQLLIVEDDIGLNQGLCKALKADARQIISCQDLKTAKEQLLCGGVSLILLDINLPDGSGLELLREVKENTPYIPVILLTANDTDLDIVDGLERGADDYITKPFSLSVLRARVNTQLRKQASNHKNAPFHMDLFHFDFEAMTFYSDTGSGIPETEQAKIFARFYRSNSVQKQEGVGIGLYLARQIISGEGGYIKVASVPGKGSTFSIFLPK